MLPTRPTPTYGHSKQSAKHALPVVVRYELVGVAEYAIKPTEGAGETLRAAEPIPLELDPAVLHPF